MVENNPKTTLVTPLFISALLKKTFTKSFFSSFFLKFEVTLIAIRAAFSESAPLGKKKFNFNEAI